MKPVVIVDLDGTLYDSSARQHLAQNQDWEAFHEASADDPPNEAVLDVLSALPPQTMIIACTGRNEGHRKITEDWMIKHCVPVDEILMRPQFDFRSDAVLKPQMMIEWAEAHCPGKTLQELVWFVLDDRDKVVEAWRAMGLPCWQVNEGVY